MDYKNGKIYRLVCNVSGKQYIGSTTQPLRKRLNHHKSNYKMWKDGYIRPDGKVSSHIKSFEIIENDDYDIVLIEDFPCQSKNELERRERYWIENSVCVNRYIPSRSKEERQKQWYENNKEQLLERYKQYYKKNKDKIDEYMKQPFQCECGSIVRYGGKSQHFNTQKHIKWEQQQQK